MVRVLITDKLAQEAIDLINATEGAEAVVNLGVSEDELTAMIGEYEGLIIRSGTKATAKVLANPGKLKAIARAGVGVDNIDLNAAQASGVTVMNTPGGNTVSVAEHAIGLMIALSRNVVPGCNTLKAGAWDRKKYMGNQLNRKTLGLIGLGRIALATAARAKAFNMKIVGFDPYVKPEVAAEYGIEVFADPKEIYKQADYISIHVPKTPETTDMIAKDELAMMKPGVRLINTSRGGIINEDALYDALEAGAIAGAAIDVFVQEPPENTRFSNIDSCLVTPHLGASSVEAQIDCGLEAAQQVLDCIMKDESRNVVKPK